MKPVLRGLIGICLLIAILVNSHSLTNGSAVYGDDQIFSPKNYKVIAELKGQTFKRKIMEITKKDFLEQIKNPFSFTLLSNAMDFGGIISNKKELLMFALAGIEEDKFQQIIRFNLPKILSDNLRMNYIYSYTKERTEDRIIIFDDKNNTLITMDRDPNGNFLEIKNAIKYDNKHPLTNLKVICGYTVNNSVKLIFAKKDKIFVVDNDTMKLIRIKQFTDWNIISGYRRNAEKDEKVDSVFLYQIKGNILRKYDYTHNKIVYHLNLKSTPIKGKIIKIETDKLDLLYILTESNGKNILYNSNESAFNWFSYTDTFEDDSFFGKIEDVCYFSTVKNGMLLGLFQRNSQPPIRFIDTVSPVWKEVPLKGNQTKQSETTAEDREDTVITKVITDIAHWNHPTKAVFNKYGFKLTKIEFTRNNTYPIFYVEDNHNPKFEEEEEEDTFLEELANKNGYWDFKVTINKKTFTSTHKVSCDKKHRKVENKELIIVISEVKQ